MAARKFFRGIFLAAPAALFALFGLFFPAAHADQGPVLKDILRNTEVHYQQLKAYTAHFRQKTTSASAAGMSTLASGSLFYQKPRQMRWEYETPEAQVFVANQQYAWLYVPEEKQISLFEGKAFFSSPIARTFFDGIFELRKQFEVTLEAKETTQTTAVLNLVPKEPDPNVQSLRLWINLEDYRIVCLETKDALGNINQLIIEVQKEVAALDSKLFQLEAPPGTVVTDAEGQQLGAGDIEEIRTRIESSARQ